MQMRGRRAVCLFCQLSLESRPLFARAQTPTPRRNRSSTASPASKDAIQEFAGSSNAATPQHRKTKSRASRTDEDLSELSTSLLTEDQLQHQLDLFSPRDVYRRVFLGPKGSQPGRDIVARMKTFNSNQELYTQTNDTRDAASVTEPHKTAAPRRIATLLLAQIRACRNAKELLRVFTTAMQSPRREFARVMAEDSAVRAAIHNRCAAAVAANKHEGLLELLNCYISYSEQSGFRVPGSFFWRAIHCAALEYDLGALKSFLERAARFNVASSASSADNAADGYVSERLPVILHALYDHYVSQIPHSSSSSINIQQSRDILVALLYGPDSPTDPTLVTHPLRTHLQIAEVSHLEAWLALLAALDAPDLIQREWETLSSSALPSRVSLEDVDRRNLFIKAHLHCGLYSSFHKRSAAAINTASTDTSTTSAANAARAWALLPQGDSNSSTFSADLWPSLTRAASVHPPFSSALSPSTRAELGKSVLEHLATHASKLEGLFGVKWIPDADNEGGSHAVRSEDEVKRGLALLAADDFQPTRIHGFGEMWRALADVEAGKMRLGPWTWRYRDFGSQGSDARGSESRGSERRTKSETAGKQGRDVGAE